MIAEKLQKHIFILFCTQNIFEHKIFLFCKNFVVQKKYIYIQSKINVCSMKFFYSMIFGNQIWSSIC